MNQKIKVVLVDDEISPRIIARSYLSEIENIVIVGEASNVAEAKLVIDTMRPDLVLLDIQLGNQTGFDLLKNYKELFFKVIFITAFEQFALAAIKAGALDYLLKPIDETELINAVKKVTQTNFSSHESIAVAHDILVNKRTDRISLSANDGYHVVWLKDIVFCSASGNYTTFHLINNKQIVISKIIKEYEELLPTENFLRVHQSYLVNMNYVEKFTKDHLLILQNGAEVMVASRKKDEVLNWLKQIS